MNIWTLNKDQSIKQALLVLQMNLGEDAFVVDLNSDTVDRAVYLYPKHSPDFKAYLFTVGHTENMFGIHLEFPRVETSPPQFYSYEDQTIESITEKLRIHFDLC